MLRVGCGHWHGMPRAAAVGTLLVLVSVAGCTDAARAPRAGVSVQELTGDVSGAIDMGTARVGSRISLVGTVVRVLPPGAFELRPADGATARPVLVLGRQHGLQPGQSVQVAGFVRLLLEAEQAEQAGAAEPDQLALHDGKRIVEAYMVDTNIPQDDR